MPRVENPIPRSEANCRRVSPLLDKIRTASRLKATLCFGAISGLLYREHGSQKTGRKPLHVYIARLPSFARPPLHIDLGVWVDVGMAVQVRMGLDLSLGQGAIAQDHRPVCLIDDKVVIVRY